MTFREVPFLLALIGAIVAGIATQTAPALKERKAVSACLQLRPSEGLPAPVLVQTRYGWGREMSEVIWCLPPSTATVEEGHRSWKREVWGHERDERIPLAISAGLNALLVAWAVRACRRSHREHVKLHGIDVPVEPQDGYREPTRVRRTLTAEAQRIWKTSTTRAAVTWSLATLVVAWAGSGRAMLPMPWALALWTALTLPGSVAHVHWRGDARWGVQLPALGVVALMVGGAWSCGWVAVMSAFCALCAWDQERYMRRHGSG